MATSLPDEISISLNNHITCRELQIRQLAGLIGIRDLTTISVLTSPQAHAFHHSGVPHIHFPPYTRAETLSILSKTPLLIRNSSLSSQMDDAQIACNKDDSQWLWTRFVGAVWDSLGQSAARDIVSFREICSRLWKPFIQPILDGHYGARESSKLMVRNKGLFQSEAVLVDSILPLAPTAPKAEIIKPSYNPSKHDITLFSKTSLAKRRKKGGGTALAAHRASQHRKISRKLLGPQLFTLERLFAMFHAILPHSYGGGGSDAMCELATLVSLRLVVKSGGVGDMLEGGAKWRVNVGWSFVRNIARGAKFDIESYLAE
ncbi:origin recognition complex subunit 5, partial [Lecanoromycetidae sp. Uapishka_2]